MRAFLLALLATPLAVAQVSSPETANLSITGTVADQVSGAPVAGARVVLSAMGLGRTLVYSDAAGHFRFDGLHAGPHNLVTSRTGYLQASQPVAAALGNTYTVIQNSDDGSTGTLRWAIQQANRKYK